MIDIHSHVIPFVDDGSQSLQSSLDMLRKVESQGVKTLFCTPHFRYGFFDCDKNEVSKNFNLLKEQAQNQRINVNLLLGQEIHYNKNIVNELKNGQYLTLNNSKYVLIEFPYEKKEDMPEVVYNLVRAGYEPVVAHYERYYYADVDTAYELRALGGHIQITASSIFGEGGLAIKKLATELLKNNLVDFVAGDYHEDRSYRMDKASKHIRKKYGEEVYENLFVKNAEKFV